MENSWQVLEEVGGSGVAEILRGLLQAQDIPVLLSQEGAGHFAYPTTMGRLGWVQILVPASCLERAQQILASYHAGELIVNNENPVEDQVENEEWEDTDE
jgi:hypothetical protein